MLKVLLAAGLIGWLIRSGALDFHALLAFFDKPWLLVANLATYAIGIVFGTLRWRSLLAILDVRLPFARLVQIHYTGQFFNVVIPGNVGGDLLKAVYVARDAEPSKRPSIYLIGFVDRLIGLAGLVLIATLITVARGSAVWSDPLLYPLASAVAVLGVATIVGPIVFVLLVRRAGPRLETWTSGPSKIGRLIGQLVAAVQLVAAGPKNLVATVGIAMIQHGLNIAFFTVLTRTVTGQDVSFASIATVFPLGLLTMVVPIAPAGLGVGHVAFDKLFAAIGRTGGATVFNAFLLGQMAPCLLGVFPYLALRRDAPDVMKEAKGG